MVEIENKFPIIALLGRPNVGKSTIFNLFVKGQRALVDDLPGVTRDPIIGLVKEEEKVFNLVDLGGVFGDDLFQDLVEEKVIEWVKKSDLVVIITDGKAGLLPYDKELLLLVKKYNKNFIVVANKIDNKTMIANINEFYQLGVDKILPLSAIHKIGLDELYEYILNFVPDTDYKYSDDEDVLKISLLGKPNVGKSSLINRLFGSERVIVSSIPGTTRDAVDVEIQRKGRRFIFLDTPGVRKRKKINKRLEKRSSFLAIESIDKADIILLVVDAADFVRDQDIKLLNLAKKRGKGVILLINKIDKIEDRKEYDTFVKNYFSAKLQYVSDMSYIYISAKTGEGVKRIFPKIIKTDEIYSKRITTGELNRFFKEVIEKHPHPLGKGHWPVKFYYITQVSVRPPTFVLFTNKPDQVSDSYKKYISNSIKKTFGYRGIPVRIRYRERA